MESEKIGISYLHSRNRDTDIENKRNTKGERGGMNWEIETDIYTLLILCIKWITNESLLYSTQNSTLLYIRYLPISVRVVPGHCGEPVDGTQLWRKIYSIT